MPPLRGAGFHSVNIQIARKRSQELLVIVGALSANCREGKLSMDKAKKTNVLNASLSLKQISTGRFQRQTVKILPGKQKQESIKNIWMCLTTHLVGSLRADRSNLRTPKVIFGCSCYIERVRKSRKWQMVEKGGKEKLKKYHRFTSWKKHRNKHLEGSNAVTAGRDLSRTDNERSWLPSSHCTPWPSLGSSQPHSCPETNRPGEGPSNPRQREQVPRG